MTTKTENPDDPFPDLVETICVNVCGREDMGNDAEFVAWLRRLLTKKLASAQEEHAAWRERAEKAERERTQLENDLDDILDALCRSFMEHGDCKSGKRYGGLPKACTACMSQLELKELAAKWKGRKIRLA